MELNMEAVFSAVEREDVPVLLSMFHNNEARVALPSFGTVSNNRVFRLLVGKLAARLRMLNITAEHLGTHRSESVLTAEYRLEYVFYDEERKKDLFYTIPTALVCDLDKEGKVLTMTAYTAMEYFVGKEIIRPAFRNGDTALWQAMPASVSAYYEAKKPDTIAEPCRVHSMGGCLCVEENILMTRGAVCTPQAHLRVFSLNGDGTVAECREYGEVVWDFKLWPTLY